MVEKRINWWHGMSISWVFVCCKPTVWLTLRDKSGQARCSNRPRALNPKSCGPETWLYSWPGRGFALWRLLTRAYTIWGMTVHENQAFGSFVLFKLPQNRVTGPGATLGFQVLQRELGGCVAQLGVEIWLMGRQGAPIGPRNLSKSLTFVSLQCLKHIKVRWAIAPAGYRPRLGHTFMVSSIIRLWPRLSGHCRPPADFRSQLKVVDIDHRERVGAGKVKYHSALSKARSWLWVEIGATQHAWDIVSISTYIHASIPTKLEILKQTDLFWRRMLMVYAATLGKHGQTISLYGSWRAPILGWKKTGNAWTDLVPLYCQRKRCCDIQPPRFFNFGPCCVHYPQT